MSNAIKRSKVTDDDANPHKQTFPKGEYTENMVFKFTVPDPEADQQGEMQEEAKKYRNIVRFFKAA